MIPISVPIYGGHKYLKRAVTSLLAQTVRDILVCVVSDGEPERPWAAIAGIQDDRLIRYDLDVNKGPYFIHELVRRAFPSEYFAILDADDWAEPNWLSALLAVIERDKSVGAVSRINQQRGGSGPAVEPSEHLSYSLYHTGLWRSDVIGSLGGYYGGERISYDQYMTSQIRLVGGVSLIDKLLYHQTTRSDSLTYHPATGMQSATRRAANRRLQERWAMAYKTKLLPINERAAALSALNLSQISQEDKDKLEKESAALAASRPVLTAQPVQQAVS